MAFRHRPKVLKEMEARREEKAKAGKAKEAAAKRGRTMWELGRYTLDMLKPPKMLGVADWADQNRVLVTESSAEPGRWRTDRAPYQREIMNCFTQPGVWQIVIMASAQVGKTELELNMMGRAIDIDPGPMLFIQPTDGFAEDFSKRRVAPMIRACGALARKVYEAKSRDAGNTITMKSFPGGSITFTGANSPTELAGRPVRYVFMDEIDRFPGSAGTEGDPLKLAEQRTETFKHSRKIVKTSTPTIKGSSKIEREYERGTMEEWHTECPQCKTFSFVRFEQIKFDKEMYVNRAGDRGFRVRNVRWVCPHCGAETGEHQVKRCAGKWIAQNPDALEEEGIRSFRLNAFMSPWSDWSMICRDFLKAHKDPELLKVFVNTILGETWEVRENGETPEKLFYRREEYEAEVPDGVLVLTMGVDTQDNRLEYEVVGWNRHEESWGIQRGIIPGRPDAKETWEAVDLLLDREWEMKSGIRLKISGTFVDSGGHFTEDVYRECARRQGKRVWAIRGEGGEGKPYVRLMQRAATRIRALRYIIGVDSGKEAILYNTTLDDPGPHYMHFPKNPDAGYDLTFFHGLCSEKLVAHRKAGQTIHIWEKIVERNEPLDCRNYARAVYRFTRWNFDRLEQILGAGGIRMASPKKEEPEVVQAVRPAEPRRQQRRISAGIRV